MNNVAFNFDSYHFYKASLNFQALTNKELTITLVPRGTFHSSENKYDLQLDVIISNKDTGENIINVSCIAFFSFNQSISIGSIPDHFYPNSIAIIYPYIRSFISTLSLQANVSPVVLPTINLMGLTEDLKTHTTAVD